MAIFEQIDRCLCDVNAGRFVDHGEYNGHLYGTTFDQVTSIVNAGFVCVMCSNPRVCIRDISIIVQN